MTTEQNESEHKPLAEIAAERFPQKHTGSTELAETEHQGALTLDDAYNRTQEMKDEAQQLQTELPKPESEVTVEAAEETVEKDAEDDGALWTNEDVGVFNHLQSEAAQWQADLQVFAQAKQINLNDLEKTDRSRAVMIRNQLRDTENELRHRFTALQGVYRSLEVKIQEKNANRYEKAFLQEKAKLEKELPNMDKPALKTYLFDAGFTNDEVGNARDHRLVILAEKARKWDEYTAKEGKPKTKAYIRVKAEEQKEDPVYISARERAKTVMGLKENASILMRGPRADKKNLIVKQAESNLRQSGSINDAYELLQLKKRAIA